MFERFTDRARRVIVLAQEEARLLNHNYIGTEHILLGLLHEGEGIAARALEALGVSTERARQEVEAIIGHGDRVPSGHVPFTPRAKKVLEFGMREAIQLGHNHIGTEHILLGLVREGEGVAATVLVKLGADLQRVREAVIQLVTSAPGGAAAALEVGAREQAAIAHQRSQQRLALGGPRQGCIFCGRDLYEVERAVTSETGALLCKDCAWLALQTMERATTSSAPVQALPMPPRVFGVVPDEHAVDEIRALFDAWTAGTTSTMLEQVARPVGLEPVVTELAARYEARFPHVEYRVHRIRFVGPDAAAVRFTLLGVPAGSIDGRVVRVGNTWKIGRDTFCTLARLGGVPCPDDEAGDDDAA
jgi:hypothetical protein